MTPTLFSDDDDGDDDAVGAPLVWGYIKIIVIIVMTVIFIK